MPAPEADSNSRVAYRQPQPAEMALDLVVAPALPSDQRIWVPQAPNVWFRPLCLSVSQGYWVNLLKVTRAGVLSRHRHTNPVHGYVLKGRWHYLEHDWVAEEGGYVYEPPGETHTLVVPEGVDEMITLVPGERHHALRRSRRRRPGLRRCLHQDRDVPQPLPGVWPRR